MLKKILNILYIIVVGALFFIGKKLGKAKATEEKLKDKERANEIAKKNSQLTDDELNSWLRSRRK